MRLLLVAGRYPWPARRGDQLRADQLLRILGEDHEVELLAPHPPGRALAPPSGVRVELYRRRRRSQILGLGKALASGMPLQAGLFYQSDLARRLRRRAPRADLVILLLARQVLHLPDLGEVPLVSDLIDSLSLNFEHRARVDRGWLRPLLRWEAKRLRRAEDRLIERAAATWVVCERDRAALAARRPSASGLAVVPIEVPIAASQELPVDAAVRRDGSVDESAPEADGFGTAAAADGGSETVVFTGNLGYFVNADAIRWFVETVWPSWQRAHRHVRLVVAGARPSAALRRLLQRAPGAELRESPPDLAPILAAARVSLAPMRCGSGVPIKVLEAWRAGVPVIASPWAAAGTCGEADRELLVADGVEAWHRALDRLFGDAALAARLAAAGRRCLEREHSRVAVAAALADRLPRIPERV